jgi:uncharacterized membrane protein
VVEIVPKIYIYICMYMYRERERESTSNHDTKQEVSKQRWAKGRKRTQRKGLINRLRGAFS